MSLLARVFRKVQTGGLPAVAASVNGRYAYWLHWQRVNRPVAWTRAGPASLALARLVPPAGRPVLVLSVPRSGSSWLGETLSLAADALYLREPLAQSLLAAGINYHFSSSQPEPPPAYKEVAEYAFAGCPAFPPLIVKDPGQWALWRRRQRRLVIKAVNPLACRWLLGRFRPRVIFLVRHPVAVALSMRKLNWWAPTENWREHGRLQAAAQAEALQALQGYPDYRLVVYEELCDEPLSMFRALYDFAGLAWSPNIAHLIEARSTSGDPAAVWETSRVSRDMASAWRGQVTPANAAELRAGYSSFDLPWYRSDADW